MRSLAILMGVSMFSLTKRTAIRFIFVVLAVGAILYLLGICSVVPRVSRTHAVMQVCKKRIMAFINQNGYLPSSLDQLPLMKGYYNSTRDGWGHPVIYSVDTNDIVTLLSLGKDHRVGGVGNNADLCGRFSPKKPDGTWADKSVEWLEDPMAGIRVYSTPVRSNNPSVGK